MEDEPSEKEFRNLLSIVSNRYVGRQWPGMATIRALNIAHLRGDTVRMHALDNAANAMERKYLYDLFKRPQPMVSPSSTLSLSDVEASRLRPIDWAT